MQRYATTLEINIVVLYKVEYILMPMKHMPKYLSFWNKDLWSQKTYTYELTASLFTTNPKCETAQMTFSGWIDKQTGTQEGAKWWLMELL